MAAWFGGGETVMMCQRGGRRHGWLGRRGAPVSVEVIMVAPCLYDGPRELAPVRASVVDGVARVRASVEDGVAPVRFSSWSSASFGCGRCSVRRSLGAHGRGIG
jgi:hypothetical protein